MTPKFLPLLMAFLFLGSAVQGHAFDLSSNDSPYDIDVIYKQEAAPYIKYVEDTWTIYQFSRESLRKIEAFTTTEYQTENLHLKLMFDLDDLRPSIKSKINYMGKTVYLVFNFEN